MEKCPNCPHELIRHEGGRECAEPGCGCIIDAKGSASLGQGTRLSTLNKTMPPEPFWRRQERSRSGKKPADLSAFAVASLLLLGVGLIALFFLGRYVSSL